LLFLCGFQLLAARRAKFGLQSRHLFPIIVAAVPGAAAQRIG
jgi:hypothetical protein